MALNCTTHLSLLVTKVRWWDWNRAYSFRGTPKEKKKSFHVFTSHNDCVFLVVCSHNVTASGKVMFSPLTLFFKNNRKKWWGCGGEKPVRSCGMFFLWRSTLLDKPLWSWYCCGTCYLFYRNQQLCIYWIYSYGLQNIYLLGCP